MAEVETPAAVEVTDDRRWAVLGAVAADDKKADDTVVLEVGPVLGVTEYFVITSASNNRQVDAVAQAIEEQIFLAGGPKPVRVEGRADATWILMDYGSFIAHVFLQETRDYYDLERLWSDVPRVDWAAEGPGLVAEAKAHRAQEQARADDEAFAELEAEEAQRLAVEAAELAALEAELAAED